MPLRPVISPLPGGLFGRQFLHQRQFHGSGWQRQQAGKIDGKNYYEILVVPVDASAQEIKKSFYHLSKTHHPDRNPSDPNASTRFVSISTAYATLSNPASRSNYDNTHLPTLTSNSNSAPRHPQGSHFSSASPAGGRPASGLSRRRTQFRGPPPSFYRSGGWGNQSAKREAAASGKRNSQTHIHSNPPNQNQTPHSKPPPHSTPYTNEDDEIPHFNRYQHLQSQTNQDARRRARERRNRLLDEQALREGEGPGPFAMFLCVGGILGFAVGLPVWFLGRAVR